jgi:hypothetical protein
MQWKDSFELCDYLDLTIVGVSILFVVLLVITNLIVFAVRRYDRKDRSIPNRNISSLHLDIAISNRVNIYLVLQRSILAELLKAIIHFKIRFQSIVSAQIQPITITMIFFQPLVCISLEKFTNIHVIIV